MKDLNFDYAVKSPTPRDLLPLLTASWYSSSGDIKQKALETIAELKEKMLTEEQYILFIESNFKSLPSFVEKRINGRFIPTHGISDVSKYSRYTRFLDEDDFVLDLDVGI